MQATVTPPPAPAAPNAPAALPAAAPVATYTGPDGVTQNISIPQSRQELRALETARRSLSDQIGSAMGRRRSVATELRRATDPVDRQGLEQRLTVLDRRIAGLENDLAVTGRQINLAPPTVAGSEMAMNGPSDNTVALASVFILFVLFPLVFVKARNMWRRGGSKGASTTAQLPAETSQRLERLEAGMEAIAIEIERVSEGQRFVTKLLSESKPATRLPAMSENDPIISRQ